LRIAIIGAGVSGLVAAHHLRSGHEITVFEADARAGGHSRTVDVTDDGRQVPIDTGFIVYNEPNYPRFTALLAELGVATQPSAMSYSMRCEASGLEWNGSSLNGLFADRRNLLRPRFHRMLAGILKLNGSANALLEAPEWQSLGQFLDEKGIAGPVVDDYLLPMAGAIWSAESSRIRRFPAAQFGRFFSNHGLFSLGERPQWRTVSGGSREYLRALTGHLGDRVRLATPVEWVRRLPDRVLVKARGDIAHAWDAVVFACHSDQALALLRDPSLEEREVLGAIRYEANEAVLHTDTALLPRRRRAWAAWNYHRGLGRADASTVTYNLTTLQRLAVRQQYLVTLNATEAIDPRRILERFRYDHPVFDGAALAAQKRWKLINGAQRSWFCGAYWGYGFHEDGVASGEAVARGLNGEEIDAQLHLRRVG